MLECHRKSFFFLSLCFSFLFLECTLEDDICVHIILLFLTFQAELYRVKKLFDKAEPLYLEAISILEGSYGPEDIRYNILCRL